MSNSNDYVTKKDLTEALEANRSKIVDEITEVIRDGFGLAATKKDVAAVETRMSTKKDVQAVEASLRDKIEATEGRLLEEISGHEELEDVASKHLEKRVDRLEKHVFQKVS